VSPRGQPRACVEAALRGERPPRIPFTIYTNKRASEALMPALYQRGLCEVHRTRVVRESFPSCRAETTRYEEGGVPLVRQDIRTPAGDLYAVRQPAGFTTWTRKHFFTNPNDYKPLAYYLNDTRIEPADAGRLVELDRRAGPCGIVRGSWGLEPLQALISSYMGTQTFCLEWMDRRDEVLKLYDILVAKRRLAYPIAARAPACVGHFNYGGNVVPEIVGPDTFRRYYVPHYQEAAGELHKHGKKIGVHFDANCGLFKDAIAQTNLDYIEAFTPAPDTDMTVREAREVWPDKVLWINFPSSLHLKGPDAVARTTVDLIREAEPPAGFLIAITEDVPAERVDANYQAILDGIDRYERAQADGRA